MRVFNPGFIRVTDIDGSLLPGAKVWLYEGPSTLTPVTVYADSGGITPRANPVVADANGLLPVFYWNPDQVTRAIYTRSAGDPTVAGDRLQDIEDIGALEAAGFVVPDLSNAAPTAPQMASFLENGEANAASLLYDPPGGTRRSAQSRMRDLVSFGDFNPHGNGTTIDNSAFDAAKASARTIFVPAGLYLIEDRVLDQDEQTWYAHRDATFILTETDGTAKDGITVDAVGVTFRGLRFKRANDCLVDSLFRFVDGVEQIEWDACHFDGNMRGQTATYPDVYYREITSLGTTGNEPNGVLIRNNHFYDCGNRALDLRAAQNGRIISNHFDRCGTNVPGDHGTCIEVAPNETGGTIAGRSRNWSIVNNTGARWGDGFINVRYTDVCSIANNVAEGYLAFGEEPLGTDENGIALIGGEHCSITGNVIRMVKSGGIMISTSNGSGALLHLKDISIAGNVLEGGADPFNVGATPVAETSLQVINLNSDCLAENIAVVGNALRHDAPTGVSMSLNTNATTGIIGLSVTGNRFYGGGIGSTAYGIVWSSEEATLKNAIVSGNSFYNYNRAIYAPSNVGADCFIGPNEYGNCANTFNEIDTVGWLSKDRLNLAPWSLAVSGSDWEVTSTGTGKFKIMEKLFFDLSKVPTYADNTAATGAGLVAGDVYKTSAGDLMITV